MPLHWLLAGGAMQIDAQYVGSASHNEFSSGVPLPIGVAVGDLCVVSYHAPRTLSGGAGSGWTTFTTDGGNVKASWKRLQAGDISTPLVLDGNAPVTVMAWRGPTSISAQRTSGSGAAPASPTVGSFSMTGFTKDAQCVGLVAFALGLNGTAEMPGPPWEFGVNAGPLTFQQAISTITTPSKYVNGTSLDCITSFGPGTGYAAVHELLA